MPRVIRTLRQTSEDLLGSVSAAANTVTSVVQSGAHYADALEAHAEHYSATTRAELSLSAESFQLIARERARVRITNAKMDLIEDLKDPEFKAIYDSIKFDDELTDSNKRPTISAAT